MFLRETVQGWPDPQAVGSVAWVPLFCLLRHDALVRAEGLRSHVPPPLLNVPENALFLSENKL